MSEIVLERKYCLYSFSKYVVLTSSGILKRDVRGFGMASKLVKHHDRHRTEPKEKDGKNPFGQFLDTRFPAIGAAAESSANRCLVSLFAAGSWASDAKEGHRAKDILQAFTPVLSRTFLFHPQPGA